jgi:D-inositol-3-phosphate glycosyltransferase
MVLYKVVGKKVVFTAHNVNSAKRDGKDSWFNRVTLKGQYCLCDHILVHTEKMRQELVKDFSVPGGKVTVIPFGINNTLPNTELTIEEAKKNLGLRKENKTILFFGRISPYKGLSYLVDALKLLVETDVNYRVLLVGQVKDCPDYWSDIQRAISTHRLDEYLIERIDFVPDEEVEVYFKAADVSVLPYKDIFQSGVLFLSYSFGLPVIASDVGSFREDIREGRTGFLCKALDAKDLARVISNYFSSSLFAELPERRAEIRAYANDRYSWKNVALIITDVYSKLLLDGSSTRNE